MTDRQCPWLLLQLLQDQLRQRREEAKRNEAAAAQDQLQVIKDRSSKRVCSGDNYGEVVLPPGVLQQVMACLADFAPDGVRGPAMAAADLANAALVSKHNGMYMHFTYLNSSSKTCLGCVQQHRFFAVLRL
jgi:hypothetical protein